MLKKIKSVPRKIFGIMVGGKISEGDYDTLLPEIESYRKKYTDFKLLLVIDDFQWKSDTSMLEDIKCGANYIGELKKMAIVSSKKWVFNLSEVAEEVMPTMDFEDFEPQERDKAVKWLRQN